MSVAQHQEQAVEGREVVVEGVEEQACLDCGGAVRVGAQLQSSAGSRTCRMAGGCCGCAETNADAWDLERGGAGVGACRGSSSDAATNVAFSVIMLAPADHRLRHAPPRAWMPPAISPKNFFVYSSLREAALNTAS